MLRARAYAHLIEEADYLLSTLGLFRAVLRHLETYPYERYPHLGRLCAPFRDDERRPAQAWSAFAQNRMFLGDDVKGLVPDWAFDDADALHRKVFVGNTLGMPHWGLRQMRPRDIVAVERYIRAELREGV